MLSPMLDPLQQRRVDDQLRLAQLARAILPQAAAPYFAHMRLEVGGRIRDVLLGAETRTEGGLAIIDWRAAPLAEVFFTSAEGDDYEIEADERMLAGTLPERNLVEFSRGELSAIEAQ